MPFRAAWYASLALVFACALVLALSVYPLDGNWLAAVLLAYLLMLAWQPAWWLFALPVLLPALDLAPQTGWFFLEELDLVLMATAASCYWRLARHSVSHGAARTAAAYPGAWRAALAGFSLFCMIALWRGVQPLPPVDANAFTNYLSPYNALRVGKGWLGALILLPPLRHEAGAQLQGLRRYLVPGLLSGLAIACYDNVRERVLFPGLLNFSTDYRSSAPFSAMHTGGAALDGYLALTFPLAAFWLLGTGKPRQPLPTMAALALLALAGYVGMATFSRGLLAAYLLAALLMLRAVYPQRLHLAWPWWPAAAGLAIGLNTVFEAGGYRGFALALLVLGSACLATMPSPLWRLAPGLRLEAWRHVPLALALLFALALAIPFGNGYYTAQRLASTQGDLRLRLAHWRHTLSMMPDNAATMLLGMGLGTFPATYYWHNRDGEQPASYSYVDQEHNRYLRLASADYAAGYGEMLRMLQRVELRPYTPYRIAFDARGSGELPFLYANVCERQLLYPEHCLAMPRLGFSGGTGWRHLEFSFQSGPVASPTGPWRPPVQLEFSIEGKHALVDIDNVSLLDTLHERELVRNGSFTEANGHWFFSSDRHHLPWHIKNLALNVAFETGLGGLLCFGAMVLAAGHALWRRSRADDRGALLWLASLLAFLVVGLFDSLLDVPRITLLFMLVMAAAMLQPGERT
jgi:hypothetical protein